jgi:REP element-mobilizing transposase RayT
MRLMSVKPKRYQHQGCLHFITFSCYRRMQLLDSPVAREVFEQELERVRRWYGCYVTGYVVMPEHVHLLISEPEHGELSLAMQMLKQKMFFVLSNAIFDASIAAWETKRAFDSIRPVTAIPFLFRGKTIRAWGGPGKGTVEMDGSQWIPYQQATFPTPPFPEYVSGHSTYSAAAAHTLELWTGSDHFGYGVTLPEGSSKIEPGSTPAYPVTLHWETFTDAANEASISRRYGGIHFRAADLAGRLLGRLVAFQAWSKAQSYFEGDSPDAEKSPVTPEFQLLP